MAFREATPPSWTAQQQNVKTPNMMMTFALAMVKRQRACTVTGNICGRLTLSGIV